ncbi:MAG: DNA-binding protein [Prevotella sp.]|nr:DNA-binding protein [Prevotella sp.]
MLHYQLYQNKSKASKGYGKWYGRAVVNQTIGLDQLAEHMANHNTPYSKGAIQGVLTDMVICIRELVLDGNAVKIPNLAIFSAGFTTEGALDRASFTAGRNIKSAHLRARSTGNFTRAELTRAANISEATRYDPTASSGSSSSGGGSSSGGDDSASGGSTSDGEKIP